MALRDLWISIEAASMNVNGPIRASTLDIIDFSAPATNEKNTVLCVNVEN